MNKQKIKTVLLIFIGVLLSGFLVFLTVFFGWMRDLPDIDLQKLEENSGVSMIYDKNDKFITNYSYGINQEWVDIDKMPEKLKDAFIAIEDKNFYKHHGIYTKRFVGAILGQLTGLADYGGSTITQQLVKNVYLTPELSYKRKAQEYVLTKKIERKLSKDQILEAYMNVIYTGGQNYGVKAAATDYFNKDLNSLNLKEVALIAGLAQSPNGYNPKINKANNQLNKSEKRANDVLFAMHEQGKISDAEYEEALAMPLNVNENKSKVALYPYPHFIEYMINEVATDISNQSEGSIPPSKVKENLLNGGYKIYTNLDTLAQSSMQDSFKNYASYPEIISYDKNKLGEQRAEAAGVVIDRGSGGICAIVGSRELPTQQSSYNRAVMSLQPMASTLKPLSIFAPCIESGLGSGSIELDMKLPIVGYDNNGYPGGVVSNKPMSMSESLATSHNVSAARFLYKNVGDELSLEYLYKMNIKPDRIKKSGQSLVLGTSNSTVMETARAYSVFINNGDFIEPKTYRSVVDKDGNVIIDASKIQVKRKVFSPSTVYIMNEMFKNEVTSGTGKAAKIKNITTGGKTGTHEDRVVSYAGLSPYYLSVVRISNDNYLPMKNAWGGTNAAGLFSMYMSKIHEGMKDKDIQSISMDKAGVEKIEVSVISGLRSTGATKEMGLSKYEFYKKGTAPKANDNTAVAVCGWTGNLADAECYKNKYVKYKIYAGPGTVLAGINPNLLKLPVKAEIVTSMPKAGGHKSYRPKKNIKPKINIKENNSSHNSSTNKPKKVESIFNFSSNQNINSILED